MIIALGLTGFLLLFLYDLASLRRVKYRAILAFFGYLLHAGAVTAAVLAAPVFRHSGWACLPGGILVIVGGLWLSYSLFLFPSIAHTYHESIGPQLTNRGPYAFSRHPGVLGHAVMLLGLALVFRSAVLLRGILVWIPANLLYVWVQDCCLFPRLFPDYGDYRRNTPMLFPTAKSLREFWQTK